MIIVKLEDKEKTKQGEKVFILARYIPEKIKRNGGQKMYTRTYRKFPKNINLKTYKIDKKTVIVDGFMRFSLKSLKEIDFNIRVGYPHDLFVAIDKA